ncbi:MAG: dihydrodipicolinate synthase [Pseudomonadota bacterium]|jgi:4-hydroxy-tetrahydrodipicolinate synthase
MAHPNGFQGTMTALVTPMRRGAVDEEALRRLVHQQLAGGVDVLVPCGTTGEGATLTADESARVVRACVEESKGRARVVAGCGSNATATTVENVRRAKAAGAEGALVVTPYYNKPQQEGLVRHYEAVAKDGGLPVILYNVPGRTSVDMAAETVGRLSKVPGIVGIKESSGSIVKSLEILEFCEGRPFDLLAGDDGFALAVLALGGDGVVSVASNVVPERVSAIVKAFRRGDLKAAQSAQVALNGLVRALFVETNPAPIKAAMQLVGLMSDEVRLPLVPAAESTRVRVRVALTGLGVVIAA